MQRCPRLSKVSVRLSMLAVLVLFGLTLGDAGVSPAVGQDSTGEPAAARPILVPVARGMTVETDRFRAEIRDGVVTAFRNKLTGEEYLDPTFDTAGLPSSLPSGLGTQHGEDAFAAAERLYAWPWRTFREKLPLPNQHFADAESRSAFTAEGPRTAVLEYTGLTDGEARYDDEVFRLRVSVEEETGDLVVVASGSSPRPGVYAANVVVSAIDPLLSVEAPIFDGVRLTSEMPPALYLTKWPGYWDYALVAINGRRTGAVGIWAQDPQWRYKHLFYTTHGGQIALGFSSMNPPPFDTLTEARSVAWHFQAFEHSWSQAAARLRQWRLETFEFAPRPEWTQHISFVNAGVNAAPMWLEHLTAYLEGKHLERTVTFAPTIRAQPFDHNHWDNRPYDEFREHMQAWKRSGAHLMAYLQPMIMWGGAPPGSEGEKVVRLAKEARTIQVFQEEQKPRPYVDQHQLGHPGWQKWFLGWVKTYIQQGADGVYHDQCYPCPVDSRGEIDGMNSVEGMVDYMRKAATQNPGTIHGTEHLQAANSIGASLGIGSGILWGDVRSMRWQRIRHASPISNALHHPNAVIWAFPHFSDFARGDALQFHWGQDLMERRGEIATMYLQNPFYRGEDVPFAHWVNELWMDRRRAMLFVEHGLRPVFPEDYSRDVRTYFRGVNGEEFCYEDVPWGSRFVRVAGDRKTLQYARIHGAMHAATEGGISGWVFYNADGPSGLDPERYYVVDPAVRRPAVYFAPDFRALPTEPPIASLYESAVEDGFAGPYVAMLHIRPIDSIGGITQGDRVVLHCPKPPVALFVDGKPIEVKPAEGGGYVIPLRTPARVVALLREPPAGFGNPQAAALVRAVSSIHMAVISPAGMAARLETVPVKRPEGEGTMPELRVKSVRFRGIREYQLHLPLRAPKPGGTLRLHVKDPASELLLNGRPLYGDEIPLEADQTAVLSLTSENATQVALEWVPNESGE